MKGITKLLVLVLLFTSSAIGQGYTFRALIHPRSADIDADQGLSITNRNTILMSYLPIGGNSYRVIKVYGTGPVQVVTPKFSLARNLSNNGQIGGTSSQAGQVVGLLIRNTGDIHFYTIQGKIIVGGGAVNDYSHRALSVLDPVTNLFSGIWRDHAGRNVQLDYPGSVWTDANGLNNSDAVVGDWSDGTSQHGYLYSNGQFTSIDVPGAILTRATCINNNGDIGGVFINQVQEARGFILKNGLFIGIDFPVPDGVERLLTTIDGLNDDGKAVGNCLISNPAAVNGLERFAFVATPN